MADLLSVEKALIEVRKAYRLLALFQRRVLDLCNQIKGSFSSSLLFYQWTSSEFEQPPMRNGDPANGRWAWDFLPLYDFDVLYLAQPPSIGHLPGEWMLRIRVTADSGFGKQGDAETDPCRFAPPDQCESLVRLYVYYCVDRFSGNWFPDVYFKNQFPADTGLADLDGNIKTFGVKARLAGLNSPESLHTWMAEFVRGLSESFMPKTDW